MNLNMNYFANQFVFYHLKKIKNGYLQVIDPNDKMYFFGDKKAI